ncbi:hypothetical protein VI817_007860 [Penicillium citrinum]|nr:hypothetical protein VI817_007860 [Penicillium citrinum]
MPESSLLAVTIAGGLGSPLNFSGALPMAWINILDEICVHGPGRLPRYRGRALIGEDGVS